MQLPTHPSVPGCLGPCTVEVVGRKRVVQQSSNKKGTSKNCACNLHLQPTVALSMDDAPNGCVLLCRLIMVLPISDLYTLLSSNFFSSMDQPLNPSVLSALLKGPENHETGVVHEKTNISGILLTAHRKLYCSHLIHNKHPSSQL
jgi:hypothetical protein